VGIRRQDTKQRILDAAIDLFATRGFRGASMRDIAARVGIRAASLYSHFGSKDEILQTILDAYREDVTRLPITDARLAAVVETYSTETVLVESFQAIRKGVSTPQTERILRLLLNEMFKNPAVGAFGLDWLRVTKIRELARVLTQLQQKGKIRDCDPEDAAVLYNALVNDYFQQLALRRACGRDTRDLAQRVLPQFRLLAELLSTEDTPRAVKRSRDRRRSSSSCSKS
jgi:AcrR family transcriptional regulator